MIVEACGVGSVVETAVPLLQPGGVLVLVGSVTPGSEFRLTAESLVRKCGLVAGVHNYEQQDLQEAVDFVVRFQFFCQF